MRFLAGIHGSVVWRCGTFPCSGADDEEWRRDDLAADAASFNHVGSSPMSSHALTIHGHACALVTGTSMFRRRNWWCAITLVGAALVGFEAAAAPQGPPGFDFTIVAQGLSDPVGMAFAPDGRLFIAEQSGVVRVWQSGALLPAPFIDLENEVQNGNDRGLLGIALDPDFLNNRQVYLLYTVDPLRGQPDGPVDIETFSRLTRYTGTLASGGNVADLSSRLVLIGVNPSEGIPSCHSSHTIGTVMFGNDDSLFVGAGDGAHFDLADVGGFDPACFQPPLFSADQDVGAFRAQYLGTLAGKVLRIDPATGAGYADNPFFDGDVNSIRSRIWVSGLRNPYRFTVRPGSPTPGTLYIGDVGWGSFEEIDIAKGLGENFGWPCREGMGPTLVYPTATPIHSGCSTIGTRENPGPLTNPLVTWSHSSSASSMPPQAGFTGFAATGAAFYNAAGYPPQYQGALFFVDLLAGWMNVLHATAADQFISLSTFATQVSQPVALATHPATGDLYFLEYGAGRVWRIEFNGTDLNDDGVVNGFDLALLLGQWTGAATYSPCPPMIQADFNGDCKINGIDLAVLLGAWG
jgi:glucose/arabinose dehydrogenase